MAGLFLWIDFILSYYISVKTNIVYPLVFGIIYGIFNCIYVLKTDTLIYPILTWVDVMTYVYIVIIIALFALVHLKLLQKINSIKQGYLISESYNGLE